MTVWDARTGIALGSGAIEAPADGHTSQPQSASPSPLEEFDELAATGSAAVVRTTVRWLCYFDRSVNSDNM